MIDGDTRILLRIVGTYGLVAGAWILFSDTALAWLVTDPRLMNSIQNVKGLAFVGVTALLLWGLLSRELRARHGAEGELRRQERVLRLFVEHSPAAIAMFDLNMRYIVASRRYLTDYDLGEQDLVGRSHYDVFPEIPERLKEIHRRCLAGAVEKSDAEPFQRASGKLDWVSWAIHPWYERSGQIGGLILFSEVITERKQAEDRIRRLNRVYAVLSNINQVIVRIRDRTALFEAACRVAVDDGQLRLAWIGLLDERATPGQVIVAASAGLREDYLEKLVSTLAEDQHGEFPTNIAWRTGQPVIVNDIEQDERRLPQRDGALRLGYRSYVVFPFSVFGQVHGLFNLYAGEAGFFDEEELHLLAEMVQDLSFALEVMEREDQRRQAEVALQKSQARLAGVIDSAMDAIISVDADQRVVLYNRAAEQMFGCPVVDAIGQPLDRFIPERYRDVHRRHIRAFGETGATNRRMGALGDLRGLRANGEEFPIEASISQIDDAGRKLFTVILRDITERQRAEAHIRRLNRVYAVLSNINQAIVRVRDRAALFDAAVQIAVEDGGFRMAWIGLLGEREAAGRLTVAASAGQAGDYLENLPAGLAAEGLESSPTGSALISGRPVIVNDFERDERVAPRRAEARRLGYRSFVAFPLSVSGQVRGNFNLYASEAGFFDEQELRLLDELAHDLSFALEVIEGEALRRRAEEQLRYQARLMGEISDAVVATDAEFVVNSWNTAAQAIFGWTAREAIGQPVNHLLRTEQSGADRETAVATLMAAGNWRGELVQYHKDGRPVSILASVSLLHDSQGRVIGAVSVSRDISERKQAEALLEESRRRLQALFDTTLDAILITNDAARYVDANPAACALIGYSRDELLQLSVWDVTPIEYHEAGRAAWEDFLKQGASSGEYPVLRKDGSIVEAEYRAVTNFLPGLHLSSSRDITERKRAEAALQERLAMLNALYAEAHQLAETLDVQKIADLVTRLCVETFGARLAWLGEALPDGAVHLWSYFPMEIDYPLRIQVRWDQTPQGRGPVGRAIQGRKAVVITAVATDPSFAPWRELALSYGFRAVAALPLVTHDQALGALGVYGDQADYFSPERLELFQAFAHQAAAALANAYLFRSVTEQSEQLRGLAQRLAEAEEAERRALSRELHDRVGANLTALNLNLNLVRGQLSSEMMARVGPRLDDSLKLMEETMSQVRDVMMELRPSVLDDYGLLAALRWHAEHVARRAGLAVDVSGLEPDPRLPIAVEATLFRVAQEAFTNILKHARATRVAVNLEAAVDGVRLTIADDGVGFDPQAVRPGATRGWGMMTMRERIQAVGGETRVESQPGEGTRILVEVAR